MKYTNSIAINKPLKEVLTIFTDPSNMKHWQKGFVSIEHKEGEPGQKGSRSELEFRMNKKVVKLIETITHVKLPHEFHAKYVMDGSYNINKNFFKEVDENTTEWKSEVEFQFTGLIMQILGFLAPGSFKKQSLRIMTDFKNFAENGISVNQ